MPSLTDTAIRHALKRVEASQKQENLADGEGRGTAVSCDKADAQARHG
jgi:hypothetical protein